MPSRPVKQASTRDEATLPKKIKPPPPQHPNDGAEPPNNLSLPSNNEEVERENKETHEVEEVSNEVEDCQDVRFKVFVGGLDNYATAEEDLRKVFGGVEELTKVRLIWDSKSERRVAFLTFATVELARHAICEISDPVINGRRCWTAQIQDGYKTLYIPNICNEWTKDDLEDKLAEYGVENYEVLTLNPDRENKEKNRGYAHLDFRSSKDASEALELLKKENVSFGQNRAAKVDFASKYVSGNDEIMSHVKKVYLDGMPRAWMEEHVREHLEKLGRIVRVQLARHTPSSIRTNYCYITFETHEAAVACVNGVNADGLYCGNRKVNAWAALAKPRVRITSNKTEQACSSETGKGNEVQQDSHISGTDAPSGIDRSKRSETRNAEPQSVGKKKQFTSPERLNTGRPACMSSLNHLTSPERLKAAPSQGISRAAAHRPTRHNERKTKQQAHSRSKRPHSSMVSILSRIFIHTRLLNPFVLSLTLSYQEEVCPRSTETFAQRSRAHVDHENSSRRNSQRKEHSSRTGYGDEGVSLRPSRQNEYSYERNTKQPSNYYETHSRDYNHTSGSKSRHSALVSILSKYLVHMRLRKSALTILNLSFNDQELVLIMRILAEVIHKALSGRIIVLELALSKVLVVLSGILMDCLTLEHQLWYPGDATSFLAGKVDRGDDQRMPSRNGKDYKSRDHPPAASNDAHEEAHSSDNHRSRVKDGGSRSRGGSSRKYHRDDTTQLQKFVQDTIDVSKEGMAIMPTWNYIYSYDSPKTSSGSTIEAAKT
ncbi:polyadenylate-binding protein [Salix suchowensis]|nr:polyadenylate-binding protein [Salix suchowensis]